MLASATHLDQPPALQSPSTCDVTGAPLRMVLDEDTNSCKNKERLGATASKQHKTTVVSPQLSAPLLESSATHSGLRSASSPSSSSADGRQGSRTSRWLRRPRMIWILGKDYRFRCQKPFAALEKEKRAFAARIALLNNSIARSLQIFIAVLLGATGAVKCST